MTILFSHEFKCNNAFEDHPESAEPITGLCSMLYGLCFSYFFFGLCNFICVETKLYLVLGDLVISVAGIVCVEIVKKKENKNQTSCQTMGEDTCSNPLGSTIDEY